MRKVIVTFAHGAQYEEMQALTMPAMSAYATSHGYDLCNWQVEQGNRPLSWEKIPALIEMLTRYDVALWLDADVMICDLSIDLAAEVSPNAMQALAIHDVPGVGSVPNCGVWFLRQAMLPTLRLLNEDSQYGFLRSHGWWEQAALMLRMGYTLESPCAHRSNTALWQQTHILGNEWNQHPEANWQGTPRFRHATNAGTKQRLDMLRSWQAVTA
jgi:hypothetical protein